MYDLGIRVVSGTAVPRITSYFRDVSEDQLESMRNGFVFVATETWISKKQEQSELDLHLHTLNTFDIVVGALRDSAMEKYYASKGEFWNKNKGTRYEVEAFKSFLGKEIDTFNDTILLKYLKQIVLSLKESN